MKRNEYAKRGAIAALRRFWLRRTAPKVCRQRWLPASGRGPGKSKRGVRICDMTDAHLLNTILRARRRGFFGLMNQILLDGMQVEARRRNLCTWGAPAWLEKVNAEYREKRFLERLPKGLSRKLARLTDEKRWRLENGF